MSMIVVPAGHAAGGTTQSFVSLLPLAPRLTESLRDRGRLRRRTVPRDLGACAQDRIGVGLVGILAEEGGEAAQQPL
eukprot:2329772-Prymnesium_polylepis.1